MWNINEYAEKYYAKYEKLNCAKSFCDSKALFKFYGEDSFLIVIQVGKIKIIYGGLGYAYGKVALAWHFRSDQHYSQWGGCVIHGRPCNCDYGS